MTYHTLWDWRRRVADLYASVRANPDPEAAWHDWRQVRDGLYRNHPQTPLEPGALAAFEGLPFYPYDPALRFLAGWEPLDAPDMLAPGGADGDLRLRPFARTVGLLDALGGELTAYWLQGYAGGVLMPFADATSGHGTYGAGRYLLDTIKSADLGAESDGRTVLDFNFSYNPSCAYSIRYVCPLAPRENRLPVRVEAGERTPMGTTIRSP